MLSLRQRIFIIVGIIAAITIVVVLFIFVFKDSDNKDTDSITTPVIDVQTIADTVNENFGNDTNGNIIKKNINPEENYVKQLARIFVERLSTYSNQNDNKHIDEVVDMIAPSMEVWINSHKVEQSRVYEGVTTRVLSNSLEEYNGVEGKARALLGVEQVVSSQDENTGLVLDKLIQKEVRVDLIRQGKEWKVSGLWWQE